MKQFDKVSGKYGAPMGRDAYGTPENAHDAGYKIKLFKVKLDSSGYDDGGAYWGLNSSNYLYCAYDNSGVYRDFARAASREHAAMIMGIQERFLAKPL